MGLLDLNDDGTDLEADGVPVGLLGFPMGGQPKKAGGPNLALLAAAAGLLRPTRNGNFGEAAANGLQGYVSGTMSQRQLEQEDEAARYKQVANQLALARLQQTAQAGSKLGLTPVIGKNGRIYQLSPDGNVHDTGLDAAPGYTALDLGQTKQMVSPKTGELGPRFEVTQSPENLATTGIQVGPAGAAPVPNWRQNKADTSGAVTGAETSAKSRAEELERLGEDFRRSNAITDILQAPYSIAGGGKKTIPEMLSEATGSIPGMLQDKAKSMLGITSEGAKINQILNDISSSVVGQIERMPGAQSDAELMFMRQQAGDLGNPEIPIGIRAQKYQTVLDLQNRRQQRIQARQQEIGVNPNPAPPGARVVMETGSDPAQTYLDIQSMPDGPEKRQAMQALGAGHASSVTPQQAPDKPFVSRGAAPGLKTISQADLQEARKRIAANPSERDAIIQLFRSRNFDTKGLEQ